MMRVTWSLEGPVQRSNAQLGNCQAVASSRVAWLGVVTNHQRPGAVTALETAMYLIRFEGSLKPEPFDKYDFQACVRRIAVVVTRRHVRAAPHSKIVARVRL
jgi:hypothetical protein